MKCLEKNMKSFIYTYIIYFLMNKDVQCFYAISKLDKFSLNVVRSLKQM